MKHFSEMNLRPELVEALKRMNFIKATDVQEQVIPVALRGADVIVRAKTGTGKTAAFLIPIIQNTKHNNGIETLIIVPTRELALQIAEVANRLIGRRESVVVVYGGASINVQMQGLRRNPSMVIGTPGRIIDLIQRNELRLNGIRFLVLDEADTMLDMGFIEDVEFIMSQTPQSKQTLLFSATMPERIINIAKKHMHDFSFIRIGSDEEVIVSQIKHYYAVSDNRMKFATLLAYIREHQPKKAIIFVQTKYAADEIYNGLRSQGLDVILIHGGLTQSRREHSMSGFRRGARFLVATNVAARGIDIAGISDIINFDAPDDPRVYVHRVGRSARMDADGKAFMIIRMDQRQIIKDIEYSTNITMDQLKPDISGFTHVRVFNRGNQRRDFRSDSYMRHRQEGHGRRFKNNFRGRDHWRRQHY